MARQTPRRTAWIGIGLIGATAAIVAGAWGLRQWAPFQHPDPGATESWPGNIAPLARFAEEHTGLKFLHSVPVEFIADPGEFANRTNADPALTDRRRELLATDTAVGRALGFWSGDVSLEDSSQTLRDAADFASEWLPEEGVIVVRAKGGQASLAVLDRAELVVLLTEVLDDQHFDVARRLADAATPQQYQALLGLDLGQALWVRDRYVDQLDGIDAGNYVTAVSDRGTTYSEAVADVPGTYRALRVVAQNLGPTFVAALHEMDSRAIARAFQGDTPTALDQLSLPTSKYVRPDATEPLSSPPAPKGGELVYTRQMGPFGVYLVLAGGLPATDALTASDGWGNDGFTAYRLDGRVCVDARVAADSPGDADRIEHALAAWAATRPDEADALVGRKGTTLLLSVCDPGTDVEQPGLAQSVLDQYFGRASLLADRIDRTGKPGLSECVAVSFFQQYSAADLDGATIDVVGELERINDECTATV
jgi:hypothetical protein